MGLALMRYTQKNGMRNDPVIPEIMQELAQQAQQEQPEPFLSEEENELAFNLPVRRREPKHKRLQLPVFNLPLLPKRQKRHTERKFSKGWIAIGLLGGILILELIFMLLLFH
jgi:hypothetical protein